MKLRAEILQLLHSDHPGVVRMVRLARQYFWWPAIDADINSMVQRCAVCQTNARKRSGMNLASWQEAKEFMERIHVDVAHYKEKRFLVLVDAFSKWTDVQEVADLSAKATISALRKTFKYVGLPKTVASDCGTNLVAAETERWMLQNYIKHVRTPPGHHQSNGLAERMVQEFKIYLDKQTGEDYDRFVIAFCLQHNTSPAANGSVAADFVFTKTPRTRVSAQCTERVVPFAPIPAFVRVEHHAPAPSSIVARHGDNTSFDAKGRLVHDADVVPRSDLSEAAGVEGDANGGIVAKNGANDITVAGNEDSVDMDEIEVDRGQEVVPRRSSRLRKQPERFGFCS